MAIAEHSSTPSPVKHSGVQSTTLTLVSDPFSPPAQSLLVVMGVNELENNVPRPSLSVSDSTGGTWTLLRSATAANTGEYGTCGIWIRYLNTAPGSMTVTLTRTSVSSNEANTTLDVRVLTGANSSQTGAGFAGAAVGASTSAALSGNIVTTTSGSWVYTCAGLGNSESVSTQTGTTNIDLWNEPTNNSVNLTGRLIAATSTPGSTLVGWKRATSGGGSGDTVWVAAEILPLANTAPSVNAGNDATIELGTTFTQTATVSGALAQEWTVESGPADVGGSLGFDDDVSFTPTVKGTYVLRLTATNTYGTTSDEITVTVTAPKIDRVVAVQGVSSWTHAQGTTSSGINISASYPSDLTYDDFVLLVVHNKMANDPPSTPAGWDRVGTSGAGLSGGHTSDAATTTGQGSELITVFCKKMPSSGTLPSGSQSVSIPLANTTNNVASVCMVRLSAEDFGPNLEFTTPLIAKMADKSSTSGTSSPAGGTLTHSAFTAGTALVWVLGASDSDTVAPGLNLSVSKTGAGTITSPTVLPQAATTNGLDLTSAIAYGQVSTDPVTGIATTLTNVGSNYGMAVLVAVHARSESPEAAPTVNAGDPATAYTGVEFTRTATEDEGSDPITDRLWKIQSGPAGAGTTLSTAASFSWTPTVAGSYVLRYTATNVIDTSTPSDVTITVVQSTLPTINVGGDSAIGLGQSFLRTATVTGGTPAVSKGWEIISGPDNVGAAIDNLVLSYTPDTAGTYVFEYSYTNAAGTASESFSLDVLAEPATVTPTLRPYAFTRLYCNNTDPSPAIPSWTPKGPWDTAATTIKDLYTAVRGDGNVGQGPAAPVNGGTRETLLFTFISPPFTGGGLLEGWVIRNGRGRITDPLINGYYTDYIYVLQGSTTTQRGVLSEMNRHDIEAAGDGNTRRYVTKLNLNPVNISVGDRLVIEIGYSFLNSTNTVAGNSYLRYGGAEDVTSFYDFSHLDGLNVIPFVGSPPDVNAGANATMEAETEFTRSARERT